MVAANGSGTGVTVEALAKEKRVPVDFLLGLGLRNTAEGVVIPYGHTARARIRTALTGPSRFLWAPRDQRPVKAYRPRLPLPNLSGDLIVVEGESDCWALWSQGFDAIGLPGAKQASKLEALHVYNHRRIYVIREPDEAGGHFVFDIEQRLLDLADDLRGFRKTLGLEAWEIELFEVNLPTGIKDASELLVSVGGDGDLFADHLTKCLADAEPLSRRRAKVFDVRSFSSWATEVDSMPDPGWIAQPVWPGDAYGVMAAESKVGKTWAQLDLAVSVATGTTWMNVYPTAQGRTVTFIGEGGSRNTVRRARAILASKGVDESAIGDGLHLCLRVPHLTDAFHLEEMRRTLTELGEVRLVILDPLYLAASGANGASLYEMAVPLEAAQQVAESVGAALVVVHHFNQTGIGNSARRMSGAGPEEWGRVLAAVGVKESTVLDHGRTSQVTLEWKFTGGEIVPTEIGVRRTITVGDLNDLTSPMTYQIEEYDLGNLSSTPTERAILAVLQAASGWLRVTEIHRQLPGSSVGERAVQALLKQMYEAGTVERRGTQSGGYEYRLPTKTGP